MIPRVHKTKKEDRIMIHKNISIKAEGSLKDSHLTTYILDSYEELEPNLYKNSFKTIMDNLQFSGISIESITRARRKFFEDNPELKIDKAEKARRKKEQEYYLEYSRHTPRID